MRDDHTILTLVPGRHRLGYAVFYKNKLIFYGIASLSTFKTKTEIFTILDKFLSRILGRFSVDYIAVRKLHPSQIQSALLVEIAGFLKTFGKRRKIKMLSFDGKTVNQNFCETGARPNMPVIGDLARISSEIILDPAGGALEAFAGTALKYGSRTAAVMIKSEQLAHRPSDSSEAAKQTQTQSETVGAGVKVKPVPAPTPSDDSFRGRIQIPGTDLEISAPWTQSSPPTKAQGLIWLNNLWNSLSRSQQRDRKSAYDKAITYISRCPITGCPPDSRTFQDPQRKDPRARIDIEIKTGVAFID